MILTRRDFIKNLKDKLLENVHDSIPVLLNSSTCPVIKDEWLFLGTVADFPPGSVIAVNNGEHYLVSVPEGVYALGKETYLNNMEEPRLRITLEKNRIMLNTRETSPAGTVLSVLTGEIINQEEKY